MSEQLQQLDVDEPRTVRLVVRYDGTHFRGFAANEGVRTVQGMLEYGLEQILQTPVRLICAGRTDAGVHARGQVVSFSAPVATPLLDRLARALSSMLGPEIVVESAELAPVGFNARFDASWRRYRYLVDQRPCADPLIRHTVWHVGHALDHLAMNKSAAALVGTHDFAAFCRRQYDRDRQQKSTVRTVYRARWQIEPDGLLSFGIVADAFCQQMVRSIVGTLVDIGRGRDRCIPSILESKVRTLTTVAPPQGLCLEAVGYGEDPPDG